MRRIPGTALLIVLWLSLVASAVGRVHAPVCGSPVEHGGSPLAGPADPEAQENLRHRDAPADGAAHTAHLHDHQRHAPEHRRHAHEDHGHEHHHHQHHHTYHHEHLQEHLHEHQHDHHHHGYGHSAHAHSAHDPLVDEHVEGDWHEDCRTTCAVACALSSAQPIPAFAHTVLPHGRALQPLPVALAHVPQPPLPPYRPPKPASF